MILETKNLSLGYENDIILKNINIKIEEQDFICITGSNGAGKSTLIKGLLGLIKPKKGKIIYNIKPNFIGYMPQETKVDSNFPASVYEIVLSGTLNQTLFYKTKQKEIVNNTLKLLNIENLKQKSFSDLSGGQRQKVLLARSLVSTKKLLILDEPSNNLDTKSKKELYKTIIELNKINNITILMITHDLDHNNLIGNKVLNITDGKIILETTEDFIRRIHND